MWINGKCFRNINSMLSYAKSKASSHNVKTAVVQVERKYSSIKKDRPSFVEIEDVKNNEDLMLRLKVAMKAQCTKIIVNSGNPVLRYTISLLLAYDDESVEVFRTIYTSKADLYQDIASIK